MIEFTAGEMKKIAPLFFGVEETMIWSCLQGVMGKAWANRKDDPTAARIINGDFVFFAGQCDDDTAEELIQNLPVFTRSFCLMIPPNEDWAAMIEALYQEKAQRLTRYAFYKDTEFDPNYLRQLRGALPNGYTIVPIDAHLYEIALSENWSHDFCSQFSNAQDYLSRGMGSAVLYNGKMIGGASSYIVYNDGIEIEIGIREEHRKKGLAAACASDLILRCLEKGLYPSWDASNLISVALAKKLGYRYKGEYSAYFIKL